ncbi:MAG: elongation factor G [Actinobacteria bacterium]|nr:elongation factor G [Actinomycetota bacterium]
MTDYPPSKIRNVALVGHGGAGKTTLAEALLYVSGAISRAGRVEDGTTVCDFEPEEVKRSISASTALASFNHSGYRINLLDTPGYGDFGGEVAAALSAADLAVVVVSAVEGIEVRTEAVWRMAAQMGIARMVFVSKLDRERASFQRTLDQLRETFGTGIAPLELPLGEEAEFNGIADLLTDTAIVYQDGKASSAPLPETVAELEHEVREALVEGIVVGDDSLMERYLEGDIPSSAELEEALAGGVAAGIVYPVVCGSAHRRIGIDRLLTYLCEIGPSPLDRDNITVLAGDTTQQISCDPKGLPLARVFKTLADPYVGKISMLKVLSGTITPDTVLVNSRTHAEERLHSLQSLKGKDAEPISVAACGDIVAVPKLANTATGDTLAPKGTPVMAIGPGPEPPSLSIAIRPKSKADEDKLMTALHRLQEEDPSLRVDRVDETHQTVLSGTGETHLAITCERLQRKFGVEVLTEELVVAYRETITSPAQAEGKHKKQTGGHGQFGVATVRIEPLERGAGFEFVDKIVGGAIPRQFIPAVEKGIMEAMSSGGVHGYPVVDVRAICLDGKYHPVDSSEMSFKMAGALAFREALAQADPVLLEPISRIEVTVPSAYQGDVLGDLNARRARVQGTESADDGEQVIVALVPTAEVTRYAVDLRSITAGRGRFSLIHDHYDVVPAHLVERIPARASTQS